MIKEKIYNDQFSLLNTSLAPIEFETKINPPFRFVNETKKFHQLKSKSKIQVSLRDLSFFTTLLIFVLVLKFPISFKFDSNYISSLKFNEDNSPIYYQDFISVNFTSDVQQKKLVSVKVYCPRVEVTTKLINFGKTIVEQERQIQFSIRNNSFSAALWKIIIG